MTRPTAHTFEQVNWANAEQETRIGVLQEMVAILLNRLEAEAASPAALDVPTDLLESLVDDEECRFDHHGGCQAHGYLSLEPDEVCPQAELKAIIRARLSPSEDQK